MRGVGDERLFPIAGVPHPLKQRIERLQQGPHLARRAAVVERVQFVCRPTRKGFRDRAEGGQAAPDAEPDEAGQDGQDCEGRHQLALDHIANQSIPDLDAVADQHPDTKFRIDHGIDAPALAVDNLFGKAQVVLR